VADVLRRLGRLGYAEINSISQSRSFFPCVKFPNFFCSTLYPSALARRITYVVDTDGKVVAMQMDTEAVDPTETVTMCALHKPKA
jgi:hypothetical protein